MHFLNTLIKIAVDAHSGQTDLAGQPYILHPLSVMLDPELTNDEERAAAVGHDLLEDTQVTTGDLRAAGIPESVIEAIESVTRRDGEAYESLLARASANPIGLKVKRADVRHNSSPARIRQVDDETQRGKLIRKYTRARELLRMDMMQLD
jgi:(p)ppGpp synthase/HD superfamily hydrolase